MKYLFILLLLTISTKPVSACNDDYSDIINVKVENRGECIGFSISYPKIVQRGKNQYNLYLVEFTNNLENHYIDTSLSSEQSYSNPNLLMSYVCLSENMLDTAVINIDYEHMPRKNHDTGKPVVNFCWERIRIDNLSQYLDKGDIE